MSEFKVGDKVSAFGCEGVVVRILDITAVEVSFEGEYNNYVFRNGKREDWHKEPSLKLIGRPKQKVKLYPALYRNEKGDYFVSTWLYKMDDLPALIEDDFIRLLTEFPVEVEL